eukprot:scaffold1514_cov118-Cylindrotheca_fusiformis.AAC.2
MLAHTRCLLHSNDNNTITRGYRMNLRNLVATPALHQQMMKSFGWNKSTLELVDWEVFKKCRSKMKSRFQQVTKFTFDILPTAAVVAKASKAKSDVCPLCEDSPETNDHLCQCSATSVRIWRSKLISDLEILLQKQEVQLDLGTVMISGIMSVFASTDEEVTLNSSEYPRKLHTLIEEQNLIGWRQMFRGRVSREWAKIQQNTYDEKQKKNITGTSWITEVVCLLLNQIFEVWKQRNDKVFGNQSQHIQHSRHDKALQELRMLHAHRSDYRACDVQFLMNDETEEDETRIQHVLATSKIGSLEGWLYRWIPYFADSIKAAKAQPTATRQTPSIRQIFQPLRRRILNLRAIPPEIDEPPTRRRQNPNSLTTAVKSFFTAWRKPTPED